MRLGANAQYTCCEDTILKARDLAGALKFSKEKRSTAPVRRQRWEIS